MKKHLIVNESGLSIDSLLARIYDLEHKNNQLIGTVLKQSELLKEKFTKCCNITADDKDEK